MLKPSIKPPRVSTSDRLFWSAFIRDVEGWRSQLHVLHPNTIVQWEKTGFHGTTDNSLMFKDSKFAKFGGITRKMFLARQRGEIQRGALLGKGAT